MYTIGQVSQMFHLPVSTLRYYDKEGLLPQLERVSGIRRFDERSLEAIRLIECLKKSGMEIRDIRQFMVWCAQGSETYAQRLDMFRRQRQAVETEMRKLEDALAMIQFKCWYYEQALADGSEERVQARIPHHLPDEIRRAWQRAHAEPSAARP